MNLEGAYANMFSLFLEVIELCSRMDLTWTLDTRFQRLSGHWDNSQHPTKLVLTGCSEASAPCLQTCAATSHNLLCILSCPTMDEPVHYTTGLCIASIWREASCGPPAGASIHSGGECHDGLPNTFFVCISSRWAGLLKLHGKCMEFGHVNMCPWTGHHVQVSGLANVGSLFPFRFYFWAKSSLILLLLLAISQLQRLR